MAEEVEKPEKPADAAQGADGAPAAESKPEAKRGSRLPLLLSALVLAVSAAAVAWYLGMLPFGAGHARHAEATAAVPEPPDPKGHGATAAGAEGHGAKAEDNSGPGPLLALEPFIANLADEDVTRYLKATFQVEFRGAAVPPGVDARLPQIRDLLLTLLTSKTFDDIRTPEGKQQLREEIIARVNSALDRDLVKTVYFTEFIVQ
jgi:flagellar FliL protein